MSAASTILSQISPLATMAVRSSRT
jgi:hypothetical protein